MDWCLILQAHPCLCTSLRASPRNCTDVCPSNYLPACLLFYLPDSVCFDLFTLRLLVLIYVRLSVLIFICPYGPLSISIYSLIHLLVYLFIHSSICPSVYSSSNRPKFINFYFRLCARLYVPHFGCFSESSSVYPFSRMFVSIQDFIYKQKRKYLYF